MKFVLMPCLVLLQSLLIAEAYSAPVQVQGTSSLNLNETVSTNEQIKTIDKKINMSSSQAIALKLVNPTFSAAFEALAVAYQIQRDELISNVDQTGSPVDLEVPVLVY